MEAYTSCLDPGCDYEFQISPSKTSDAKDHGKIDRSHTFSFPWQLALLFVVSKAMRTYTGYQKMQSSGKKSFGKTNVFGDFQGLP